MRFLFSRYVTLWLLLGLGVDYVQAQEAHEDPELSKQYELALAYRTAGNLDGAIEILSNLDQDSEIPIWFDLAVTYAWRGDYLEAIELLERRSENDDQRLFHARVLSWDGRPQESIDKLTEIESETGISPATLNGKALAARVMAKYQKARDLYKEVLAIDPGNGEALEGMEGIWEASQIGFSLSTRQAQSADSDRSPFAASIRFEPISGHTIGLGLQTTSIPIAGIEDTSVFFKTASASYAVRMKGRVISSASFSRITGSDFSTNALYLGSTFLAELVNVNTGLNVIDVTGERRAIISLGLSRSIGLPGVLSLRVQAPTIESTNNLVYEALISTRFNKRLQTNLRWSNWNGGESRKSRLGLSANIWPTQNFGITTSFAKVENADPEYWVGLLGRF